MILSKQSILNSLQNGAISIDPFDSEALKPASYTFRLGQRLKKIKPGTVLEIGQKAEYEEIFMRDSGYILQPGEFILAETLEHLKLGENIVCLLSARRSVAQIGLDALQSSTLAEPGTDGKLLIEISNSSPVPIKLVPGTLVVKGLFLKLD